MLNDVSEHLLMPLCRSESYSSAPPPPNLRTSESSHRQDGLEQPFPCTRSGSRSLHSTIPVVCRSSGFVGTPLKRWFPWWHTDHSFLESHCGLRQIVIQCDLNGWVKVTLKNHQLGTSPGSPVVKTPHFHCKDHEY